MTARLQSTSSGRPAAKQYHFRHVHHHLSTPPSSHRVRLAAAGSNTYQSWQHHSPASPPMAPNARASVLSLALPPPHAHSTAPSPLRPQGDSPSPSRIPMLPVSFLSTRTSVLPWTTTMCRTSLVA